MFLAKIIGTMVSTQKNEHLRERKILVAQPIDLNGKFIGRDVLAIDTVDAGVGDTVLVMTEGNTARQILKDDKIPVNSVIVAVVDGLDVVE